MTDHPLSESAVTKLWDEYVAYNFADWFHVLNFEAKKAIIRGFRAAFDIGREYGQTNPKDDRPWEQLTKDNPARVGDELRLNYEDSTITAVVGHVDECGDPWTAEGGFISVRRHGPWHVRRAVPTITNPKDNPRWEPLNGRPVQEGDEVRWYHGTMYVRRTSQKTTMEDSTTNVPESGWYKVTPKPTILNNFILNDWKDADQ